MSFNCFGNQWRHAGQEQARLEELIARVDSLTGSVNQLIAEGQGMKVRIWGLEAPYYQVSYYKPRLII